MSRVENSRRFAEDDVSEMNKELERLETILRIRKQIIALHAELEVLEKTNVKMDNFGWEDINHLIPYFTGDDDINVSTFVAEFEEAGNRFGWSETTKYVYAKRAIGGTAAALLRIVPAHNWTQIRNELIEEFSTTLLNSEVHNQLRNSKIKIGETIQQYTIRMRTIAAQGGIDELDLVRYIVEGFVLDNIERMFFLGANSLKELRIMSTRYRSVKGDANEYIEERPSKYDRRIALRCYKCNGLGHFASECSINHYYPAKYHRGLVDDNISRTNWTRDQDQGHFKNQLDEYEFLNLKNNVVASNNRSYTKKIIQAESVDRNTVEPNLKPEITLENTQFETISYHPYQKHRLQNSEEILENWRIPHGFKKKICLSRSNFRQRA